MINDNPVATKTWRYWLMRWNCAELIPLSAASIGFLAGVIIAGITIGYKAGITWVQHLVKGTS